jgi:HlyD family secretion protein
VDKRLSFRVLILALGLLAASCNPNKNDNLVSGTIDVDEVHVASRYGGRVQKIFASEGEALHPGQVLVELDAAELNARHNEAAAVLAELEAGPRKEEIETVRSEYESQKADLEFALADSKRTEELFANNTTSKTERDRAVSRADALQKSVAAAKSRYDLMVAGTRPERIAQAKAQLAAIETQLREMKILSPGESVLEVLSVKVGDVLPPNREVATLILPQHLWVRVYVPEPWLGQIKLNEPVKVRVDSFPNRDFEGTVEQINRAAEFTPRNVQTVDERIKQVFGIKVRLKNEEDKLRAGMSADVTFPNLSK